MRIAVGHADRLVREALRRSLAGSAFELAWQAGDGAELERRARRDPTPLVLTELALLGERARRLETLRALGSAVIVLSPARAVASAYEAMGRGALALVEPPNLDEQGELHGQQRLLRRLERLAGLVDRPAAAVEAPSPRPSDRDPPLVALGASTGGPLALATVLGALPADLNAAVLIVQHIEGEFTGGLASWLGTFTRLPVALAERGDSPRAGRVYVAGPGGHCVLLPSRQFGTLVAQRGDLHVPSVDALFRSLAQNAAPGIAALLTGMGSDGVDGLAELHRSGWHTIAQDEGSSVVWGMPRAAVERGAAQQVLALDAVGPAIVRLVRRGLRA